MESFAYESLKKKDGIKNEKWSFWERLRWRYDRWLANYMLFWLKVLNALNFGSHFNTFLALQRAIVYQNEREDAKK